MLELRRTNKVDVTKTNFFSTNIRSKVIIITVGGGLIIWLVIINIRHITPTILHGLSSAGERIITFSQLHPNKLLTSKKTNNQLVLKQTC